MMFSLGLGGGAAAARAFLPAFFCKPAIQVSVLVYFACRRASKGELANIAPSQQSKWLYTYIVPPNNRHVLLP